MKETQENDYTFRSLEERINEVRLSKELDNKVLNILGLKYKSNLKGVFFESIINSQKGYSIKFTVSSNHYTSPCKFKTISPEDYEVLAEYYGLD